jgi:phage recombination protein Bet
MLNMIWQWNEETAKLYPRKPRNHDGSPRVPDGREWLSIEQAAAKSGKSIAWLEADYRAVFADLITGETLLVEQMPEPVAVGTGIGVRGLAAQARPAADLPQDVEKLERLDLLRVIKYPHFDDVEWRHFLQQCDMRRLNPLSGQVYAVRRFNSERKAQEVVMVVGNEGLRLIADRTGLRGSAGPGEFTYDDNGALVSCRFVTEKKVDGEWKQMVGQAFRDEQLIMAMGDFAQDMPRTHLEKCAEAASLRRGWPQELGGLYTPEEIQQMERRQRVDTGRRADGVDEPHRDEFDGHGFRRTPPASANAGMSWARFEEEAVARGYNTSEARSKLIAEARFRFPALCDKAAGLFYAAIIRWLDGRSGGERESA